VAVGKFVNRVTRPMTIAPTVAPTRGIRSKNAIRTASGAAYGTPRIRSVVSAMVPATTLIARLPIT